MKELRHKVQTGPFLLLAVEIFDVAINYLFFILSGTQQVGRCAHNKHKIDTLSGSSYTVA